MGNIIGYNQKRCIIPECKKKRVGLDICIQHKCKKYDCMRGKFKNKEHCNRHCCYAPECLIEGKYDFNNSKNIGFINLCHNHICSYTGYPIIRCHNINLTETPYCIHHLCKNNNCYNPVISDNKFLCYNHNLGHNIKISNNTKNNSTNKLTTILV